MFVSRMFDFEVSGGSYARLSGTTSEDEGDRSAFAVNDIVAGAATGAATKAKLACLEWRSHGDGSCAKQVRDGGSVLHFGCCWKW